MRHAHGPGDWQALLERRGLYTTRADVLDHPTDVDAAGCVILLAERSRLRG